jgi:EpsI family protein
MRNSKIAAPISGGAPDAVPANGIESRRSLLRGLASAVIIGATFLAVYASTILKLIEYWSVNDMYSYGFLVPLISGYLIWLRRDQLRNHPAEPSFGFGLLVLTAGLLILVVGRISATNLVEEISLPVSVWGVSLLVMGWRVTRRLTFPLAYLFTMIPFWDLFTGRLHLPFQLYSASIGVGSLRMLNIPVFHNGTFIELPDITLEVAQVCSGVNNLVAVLCIGVPLTHYYVSHWPKRLFIVTSAVLIALLSNGVRVAGVCLFAYYGIRGTDGDVHGPYSLLRSLFISGVGFCTLFWLITHLADRTEPLDSASESEQVAIHPLPGRVLAAVGVVAAMMLAAGTFPRWWSIRPVPLSGGLVDFPTAFGNWETSNASLVASFSALDFDEKLVRGYTARDASEVNLLLGYLSTQVQGRELAGQWTLLDTGLTGLRAVPTATGSAGLSELVASKGSERFYIAYAYLFDGQVVSDEIRAKLLTTWNVLAKRRSNGGVMIIATKIDPNEELESARRRVQNFANEVVPQSAAYLAGTR